jgi:hypothetical protein
VVGAGRLALMVAATVGLASACTQGPDGNTTLQPLVFPFEGQLGASGSVTGTTVAIVVDSNYISAGDNAEVHDLHRDRIGVVMVHPTGAFPNVPLTVRSVFALSPSKNSNRHNTEPGATATVVVVDLPLASAVGNPTIFPITVKLRVEIDGVADVEPRFVLTGKTGIRNPIVDASILAAFDARQALEPRPTLRLRPKRRAGTFQPGQPALGGMEFTLGYTTACIDAVEVFPVTEASDATAVVGPVFGTSGGYSLAKTVLVDPKGFNLTYLVDTPPAETTDETLAGEGPLIDVAVDWKATNDPACSLNNPSLITISDLRVSDVDGDQVFAAPGVVQVDTVETPGSNAVFRAYPVDLPPPAPSGGC